MTSVKTHGPLTVSPVTIRRKPTFTYQSPTQSTVSLQPEKFLFALSSATTPPLPIEPLAPASQSAQMSELSLCSTIMHKSSRNHMPAPLLPLYHPFGTLALSLPDLDPTVFGLPAPVAVFDNPTRRSSNRQRRPAPKVRNADDPAAANPPSFISVTLAPDLEAKEKTSPRRRRGGGPGGRRRRREPEDGDAAYPAKRQRNSRSAGLARALSREAGSPTLSNAQSRASPSVDAGRGDPAEEKKRERRSTRSRGAIVRRDSTTSEDDTATSASQSMSATNAAPHQAEPNGELVEAEEPVAVDESNEGAATLEGESKKSGLDAIATPVQQEN